MRIKPWMTTVASMLMLVAVHKESSAQQPLPPGGFPPGVATQPVQGGYGPYVYQQPYTTNNPQAMYPQGVPPGFDPYPAVSPFQTPNVALDRHYNRDGLWLRDILYQERNYFGSIELMSVSYKDAGNSLVGSPHAQRAGFDTFEPLGTPLNLNDRDLSGTGFFQVDSRIIPFPALAASANTVVDNTSGALYPFRGAGDLKGLGKTLGTQIRWGFENQDGTGVQLNGHWTFEDKSTFTDGFDSINGVPVTQALTQTLNGENLIIRGVVAYFTGEPLVGFPQFGAGRTAKYDILFEMENSTETAGANFSLYTQPIYKTSGVKIRPLYGARYFYLHEGFGFRGVDSGFTYDIDEDTSRPSSQLVPVHAQYEATLKSDVKSNLAGPELGFRFDLGDSQDGFKMWGETIFGLAANSESIKINGDNIGDPLFEGRFENLLNPRMLDPTFQSEFADKKSTTHVSPTFQQSIFAEIQAFRSLPLIRNVPFLESTNFRAGYTFFWVGEVSRPADSINWQGFPLFPKAQVNRTSWYMHQLNFGVDWNF